MRKYVLAAAVTIGAALALAAPSLAATAVNVKATFAEGVAQQSGCTAGLFGACGAGNMVPYGSATETIQFGSGCGGACDLRTITVAQGTLVLDETPGSQDCPAASCTPHSPGQGGLGTPTSATLTDVVVGGSGVFAGASGTLNGSVKVAGRSTQILLSGPITLVP